MHENKPFTNQEGLAGPCKRKAAAYCRRLEPKWISCGKATGSVTPDASAEHLFVGLDIFQNRTCTSHNGSQRVFGYVNGEVYPTADH